MLFVTVVSGLFLSSASVSADDAVVDRISINVPTSCSFSGIGMDSHVATIDNGNYNNYAAATANTTNYTTTNVSDSANTSICPKGWVLPYGGTSGAGLTNGSFSYLDE